MSLILFVSHVKRLFTRGHLITTFIYCLTGLFSWKSLQAKPRPEGLPKRTFRDHWCDIFYRPDALPVTKSKVSKSRSSQRKRSQNRIVKILYIQVVLKPNVTFGAVF